MIKKIVLICAFLLAFPLPGSPFCFTEAGEKYGISPRLLFGIAKVESGLNPRAVGHNRNGSSDFGLMQINSFWIDKLGTTESELLENPCYNVMSGASVLRGCLDRFGESWRAVGCYNASNREKQVKYSWKVYREISKEKGAESLPSITGVNASSKRKSPVSSLWISVTDEETAIR